MLLRHEFERLRKTPENWRGSHNNNNDNDNDSNIENDNDNDNVRHGPSYNCQSYFFTIAKMNCLLSLQVFLDRFVEREIQSLLVHCIHQEEGCDWRDELRKREVTTGLLNSAVQIKHYDENTVLVATKCNLRGFDRLRLLQTHGQRVSVGLKSSARGCKVMIQEAQTFETYSL